MEGILVDYPGRCLLKSAPGHYMQYCRDDYLIVNKAALSSR